MDLAVVCGSGPPGLVDLGGPPPLIRPGDVVVLGYRKEDGDGFREADAADERVQLVEGRAIVNGNPYLLGEAVAERLAAQTGSYWVHFDVDVLDERELPAVSYPQPEGIGWDAAQSLLSGLVRRREVVGFSLADFLPARDPDGTYRRRLVGLLAEVFAEDLGAA